MIITPYEGGPLPATPGPPLLMTSRCPPPTAHRPSPMGFSTGKGVSCGSSMGLRELATPSSLAYLLSVPSHCVACLGR